MADPVSTILAYSGLDRVGDAFIKLPFLRACRAAWPQAHLTWLAGKGSTAFATDLKPIVGADGAGLIDETIEPGGENAGIGLGWGELFGARPLPGRRFDLVIDTQRRVKTTLAVRRIAHARFVSGCADWRFSDARPPGGEDKPERMVDQLFELIRAATGREPRLDRALHLPAAANEAALALIPAEVAAVGIAPGAGGAVKRWPLERFVAVAQHVAARQLTPTFLLGPEEAAWRAELADAVPGALFPLQDATGPLAGSVLLTVALARRLKAALANDSGTGHMLAAGDAPLVSLFGPTRWQKFAPLAVRGRVVAAEDFGGAEMDAIPVAAVIEALDAMLLAPPRPAPN